MSGAGATSCRCRQGKPPDGSVVATTTIQPMPRSNVRSRFAKARDRNRCHHLGFSRQWADDRRRAVRSCVTVDAGLGLEYSPDDNSTCGPRRRCWSSTPGIVAPHLHLNLEDVVVPLVPERVRVTMPDGSAGFTNPWRHWFADN